MAAAVEVDENGLPRSSNSCTMGHMKGSLIRTHCPISYKTWRQVPRKFKEDVWQDLKVQTYLSLVFSITSTFIELASNLEGLILQEQYQIPDVAKTIMIKNMASPFRRLKHECRVKYYDIYHTHEERIQHCPPMIKEEDWILFCNNENTPEQRASRLEHKKKRKQYEYTHTAGRKPHSLVRAELVCFCWQCSFKVLGQYCSFIID